MQLLELTLHNYKVHRNKTIKFEPGVVGIVGDNGTGKSSIISAICFLFTGDYDTDRKNQCVTLGETEGWVKGKFRLNGKEGTIERHLSNSTVILTYDGIPYNKSGEVEKLWNDLLQIDKTIFNNVIVAKQGEIQNLFSDETTVREKIFQKIFMVPPTEKIRHVIWDNYIKVAPPEKPEEDILQLQTIQASVAKTRNGFLEQVESKSLELGEESLIKAINDRIVFLNQCNTDLLKKPELETKLKEYETEYVSNIAKIHEITEYLKYEPSILELKQDRDEQLAIKPVFIRKQSILNEISKLEVTINSADITSKTKEVEAIDTKKDAVLSSLNDTRNKLNTVLAEKNHLLTLHGHAKCPTCKQEIPNREEYIQQLMDQEVTLNANLKSASSTHINLTSKSKELWSEISKNSTLLQRINYLKEELAKIADVSFNQQEFDLIGSQIDSLTSYVNRAQELKNRQIEISAEVRVLNEKLNNLASYDGSATITEELAVLTNAVVANQAIKDEIQSLQLEASKLEHELTLLETRIATSLTNHNYNLKRKKYLSKLEAVHDLFNVSKFPRKLIETYMSNVQASLSTYLDYFNLPYTVKVEDGFKIRLYDENNRQLPMVSGGQEMMIGICLRLALHKMFAQAFPIWIIDEGTTHLSETRKQNYFDLINELRKQKVINQIIIIDHDERLSTVVDQTVQL